MAADESSDRTILNRCIKLDPPQNLVAEATESGVLLTWEKPSWADQYYAPITGYRIYPMDAGSAGIQPIIVGPDTFRFFDTNVTWGDFTNPRIHRYKVSALTMSGEGQAQYGPASVRLGKYTGSSQPATGEPNKPTNVTITATADGAMLAWSAPEESARANPVALYRIYRSSGTKDDFKPVAVVSSSTLQYEDPFVAEFVPYFGERFRNGCGYNSYYFNYEVVAVDAGGHESETFFYGNNFDGGWQVHQCYLEAKSGKTCGGLSLSGSTVENFTPANGGSPEPAGLPVMPETIPILQPDGQISLAGAVDNGGVRTYAALEQASSGGSSGNITVLPRTIPAAAVLPPEAIPVAAAATGAVAGAVAAGAATASGTGLLAQILAGLRIAFGKITAFLKGVLEEYLIKWISKVDIVKRGLDVIKRFFNKESSTKKDTEHVLITPREIVVLLISPLVLAAAFIIAEKTWNLPAAIGIYVIIAAVAMIARDLVQKMVARHYAIPSELRFWGLGTLILFFTGGYFGNVFGAATRFDLNETAANEESGAARKKIAFVALAGPVISIVLATLFISLFPLGGLFYLVAITGFSMNLMSAAYAMMPFIPMEGADVYRWHAKVWLILFVPLILGYMIIVTPLHLI